MVGMGFRRIALAQGLLDRREQRTPPPSMLSAHPAFVSEERAPFYPGTSFSMQDAGTNDTAGDRVYRLD